MLNFGSGIFISPEKDRRIGAPWVPATPDKQASARSPLGSLERQGSLQPREFWEEPTGFPNVYAQEQHRLKGAVGNFAPAGVMDLNEENCGLAIGMPDRNRVINHIAGSYANSFINSGPGYSGIRLTDLLLSGADPLGNGVQSAFHNSNKPDDRRPLPNLNLDCSTDSNCIVSDPLRFLFEGETDTTSSGTETLYNGIRQVVDTGNEWADRYPLPNLNLGTGIEEHCSSASDPISLLFEGKTNRNLWNYNSSHDVPQCEIPNTHQRTYNSNTLRTTEFDASRSLTSSLQLAPDTPDQAKRFQSNHIYKELNLSDERFAQERDGHHLVQFPRSHSVEHSCDELLQNIVDSSSAVISVPLAGNHNGKGEEQDFDLNKTPQLKPTRKRKHRPKVIIEGKPKRTPKPASLRETNPKVNHEGKRKYVRRKGTTASESQLQDIGKETTNAPKRLKSCRRVLSFDMKRTEDDKQAKSGSQNEEKHSISNICNLNSGVQVKEPCIDSIVRMKPGQISTLQTEAPYNFAHSIAQMPTQYTSHPERSFSRVSQATTTREQLQILNPPKNTNRAEQTVFQTNNIHENLGSATELMLNSVRQLQANDAVNCGERRGNKREYCHIIEQPHHQTMNLMHPSPLSQEIFQVDESSNNCVNIKTGFLETSKKKKIEGELSKARTFTPPTVTAGDAMRPNWNDDDTDSSNQFNREFLKPSLESNNTLNGTGIYKFVSDLYLQSVAAIRSKSQLELSSESHPYNGNAGGRMLNGPTYFSNILTSGNCQVLLQPPYGTYEASKYEQNINSSHVSMTANKQATEVAFSCVASSNKDRNLHSKNSLNDHQQSRTATGPPDKQRYPFSVDEILCRLKELSLNRKYTESVTEELNALVPYKGDNRIVQYEGRDAARKRKPRPKVDLDPETDKIWKLLMEGSKEGINKDTEKYWEDEREVFRGRAESFIARMHLIQGDRRFSPWKGSVVDSVIGVFLTQNVSDHLSSSAFMSLVARFPPQQKSNRTYHRDETSGSAEGPELKARYTSETIEWSEKLDTQPIYHQNSSTQVSGLDFHTISTLAENENRERLQLEEEIISSQNSLHSTTNRVTSGNGSCSGSNSEAEDSASACKHDWRQISTSVGLQQRNRTSTFEEFHFHENVCTLPNNSSMPEHTLLGESEYCGQKVTWDRAGNLMSPSMHYPIASAQSNNRENTLSCDYQLHMPPESELLDLEHFEVLGEESISSWPSTTSRCNSKSEVNCTTMTKELLESIGIIPDKPTVQRNVQLRYQETLPVGDYALPRNIAHQKQPAGSNPCQTSKGQNSSTGASLLDNTTVETPEKLNDMRLKDDVQKSRHVPRVGENFQRSQVNKQISLEDNVVKPDFREDIYSSDNAYSTTKATTSKARKGKAEGDKKNVYDWESLRKKVESSNKKLERSKDAMDSLDYEAIRESPVNMISAAIKERGMNNMLAERIKDFLNRLVKDHGSMDLEWLRDAPPDKAKEFLLSIRGLGLKSVECVRLLTLHHVAFPVDTNVGRIAVRLGWVPLQPLPESLQLHLLELYPVLETIQKYLWPRLCKLDQRTLYELHYQLITFGKVFCTKSRPNCNACPMRGECRHFASAFASARLALPGPDEKRIVSTSVPIGANANPAIINPMLIPSRHRLLNGQPGSAFASCEPIIELPATPEPEVAEISESDIEDAFYEDPDEIPTIKLSIEEFETNLQTYMQENNMKLQEADISKALVALNPAAASIPTPKLKNVSRLRTEHQVYELPDSHPLLNGMDKRETDDPSPYLLAIWTPGETANSIEPPERRCDSQESGNLCNEDTCFSCNSIKESNTQTVRGTILMPCRTAMRGSFPLNGTYFQVNEVFADHESSLKPIDVPRSWLWNLPRRTVYFGTSVTTIFRGLTTEGIQYCFWRGFVCVRGFDQKKRTPRPLIARLHFPASKLLKTKNGKKADKQGG